MQGVELSVWITKHGQKLVSKVVILSLRFTQRNTSKCAGHGFSKRNALTRSIPDINKKCFSFHSQIIFRSGTKKLCLGTSYFLWYK